MSSLPDVSSGATWRCVDLHLHSPGVHSFTLPGAVDVHNEAHRAQIAEEYVERLRSAGIEVAVITDYQGVRTEWFTPIQQRATQVGISVLPGAELSIGSIGNGLHLLLICDEHTNPDAITAAIRHQDERSQPLFSGRAEHRPLELRGRLDAALRAIIGDLGCVVVAPHADAKNGILKEWGPQKTAEFVKAGLLDAIDQCEEARRSLQGTGLLTNDQLAAVACTLSSDPKQLDDVGAKTTSDGRPRLTWIKLSALNTSALRVALHDPQTRVLTTRPQPVHHPRVLSMEAEGGFLDGLTVRFNDDLTALIGGKGAGKSAILETLRYALDGPVYSDHSERIRLVRHALGTGGRVRLVVERPGPKQHHRYEVTRVPDQEPRISDLGSGEPVEVAPMELFGPGGAPVLLLQREIQAVARDDSFRRRLLDEIIGDDARQADAQVRRTTEELRRNQREIEDVERRLDKRDEYTERLGKVDADIAFFEGQGAADKLERQARAGADRTRLDTTAQHLEEVAEAVRDAKARGEESLDAGTAELQAAQSEHAGYLQSLADELAKTRARLTSALQDTENDLRAVRRKLDETVHHWPALVADLDAELRRIQSELGSPLDVQQYLDAVEQRTALKPIVDRLARHDDELRRLHEHRRELLRRLQEQRRAANGLRRDAAEAVNEQLTGTLEMSVAYLGDADEFTSELTTVLRGSKVSGDAISTVAGLAGMDGVELSSLVRQGAHALQSRTGVTPATAERFVRWLTDDPSRLRQVEMLAPHDRVSIALVIDGKPRDLAELSGGQKATALLLLVFAQGGRPLILDQPEDDLDNRFVYDDVVALLRAEKGIIEPGRRRQIIAATHNANIPVNGDAELVLSLADEGGRCTVRTRASIDDAEVRSEIRTVLEGGAEAFRRRAEKYGGLGDT